MSKHDLIIKRAFELFQEEMKKELKGMGAWKRLKDLSFRNTKEIAMELFRNTLPSLPQCFVRAMEENIGTDYYPEWMSKYKTEELESRIKNNLEIANQGGKNPFHDKELMDLFFKAHSLVLDRKRNFRFEKGREPSDSKELDSFLFGRKPKHLPEAKFQIDNWDELLVKITDGSEDITFTKLYDGKQAVNEHFSMTYTQFGLKQVSIEFLKICATSNNTGSFAYGNRKVKSRVDNRLKQLFGLKDMSIIIHPKKKSNYLPLFRIWYYDRDGNSIYGHTHSSKDKQLPNNI